MTNEEKKKLYAALSAPFTDEAAVERTDGKLTGRGYSTTGIKYQFVVNRLNEVLGLGCFRAHRTMTVKEVARSSGRPAFECICDLTLEIGAFVDGQWVMIGEALADGGHISSSEADARKGAYTNAFKKAAAFFGVGRQAYEGTIDDDSLPGDIDPNVAPVMKVVRAPTAQSPSAPVQVPPGYTRTATTADAPPQQPDRSRLSSKQLSCIWSIARKLGVEQSGFRSQVKQKYGCQLEFLSRQQASEVITGLNAQLHNGGEHHEQQPEGAA